MVRRWHRFRNPWDREYAMRGRLWRGVTPADFLGGRLPAGARILELGCGDGKFLAGLQAAGYRPVGLDFAPHALALARRAGARELARADVRALPVRDASVTALAARYVLGALRASDRTRALQEMERVLAPGGLAVVEEFSTRDFRSGRGRPVEPGTFERNRGILTHYFEEHELPAACEGLVLEEVEAVVSTQRVGATRARRHRWRWWLRR